MSKARIDDIEAAIIAAIQADPTLSAYIPANQVQTLSERNVDFRNEQVIILPPAVLVYYLGGNYQPKTNTWKLNLADEPFALLAVARNLRGAKDAKEGGVGGEKGAYEILEDLKTLFAGKQLTVAVGVNVSCRLVGAAFEGLGANGSLVYSLQIICQGIWDNA